MGDGQGDAPPTAIDPRVLEGLEHAVNAAGEAEKKEYKALVREALTWRAERTAHYREALLTAGIPAELADKLVLQHHAVAW